MIFRAEGYDIGEQFVKNIRILTCGIGEASAQGLNTISTEFSDTPRTAQADTIAQTIADMAAGLRRRSP